MMKLIVFLLSITAAHATEVFMFMPGNGGNVAAGASVTNRLVFTGIDKPSVTVNGTSLGVLTYPYQFSYTAAAAGLTNIITVQYYTFIGRSVTETFTTKSSSGQRIYPRHLFR